MKRRLLTLFLATALVGGMVGGSSNTDNPDVATNESPRLEESTDSEEELANDITVENEVADEDETEKPNETKEAEEKEAEEGIATKETSKEDVIDELSGIILLHLHHLYYPGIGLDARTLADIISIDPISGESQQVRSFSLPTINGDGVETYYYPGIGIINRSFTANLVPGSPTSITANYRHWFSPDYTKIAVTKFFNTNKERHVGWMDTNETFYDLTEQLGENPQSDFDDPRDFWTMGYTESGTYCYGEGDSDCILYYVVPDDLNHSNIGQPFLESYLYYEGFDNNKPDVDWMADFKYHYRFSDWLDESHCLADDEHTSYIVDTNTGEFSEYIPGTSRKNWSAVASPNGDQIAFLSMTESGTEPPSIYITSPNGGNPVELKCDLQLVRSSRDEAFYFLEWR